MPRLAVTILAALALLLVAPPIGWHALQWLVYLPFFWVLREDRPRANLFFSAVYGVVAVAGIFSWIVDTVALFSNIPLPGAVAILLLFSAVFGSPYILLWVAVHPLRRRFGGLWIVLIPSLQVLIEFAERYVFLFPYNHGVGQYQFLPVWQIVSVTGIWGATWLVWFANCSLAEALYRRRERRPPPVRILAGTATLLALVMALGAWRVSRVEAALANGSVLRVAQIQSPMTMPERLRTPARVTFDFWRSETAKLASGEADLVVWPEGASPYSLQQDRVAEVIGALATAGDFEMVIGGGARERNPNSGEKTGLIAFNSVYHVDREGRLTGRYDKRVPLPFGEYLPLKGTSLSFLVDWVEGVGNFRAGTEAVLLGGQHRYATPICYEATLGQVCRLFANPDLIVTVTNDAWFGDTRQPYLHEMMAAVRATELGVPMFRSAYTGVSAVIEPHGHIKARTKPFEYVNRVVPVRLAKMETLYVRWGDWFVVACAALFVGAALYRRGHAPAHRAPHVPAEADTHGGGSGDLRSER